jgi:long-chain fatty acid transport protein
LYRCTGYPLKFKLKSLLMRKLLTFIVALLVTGSLFAGGIVTNTNQSAAWVRLPSRNASTSIDAVYYNPAGLMKLQNGFHISLSNQFISQTREVDNSYSRFNENEFKGTASAPLFPSIYAVYKMDKLAFSVGFGVVGGGGAATFAKGLPSFEMNQSDLVPALAATQGANAYSMDVNFKGKSAFFGYQGNISYKITDWLSVAAGVRYVTAKNTYEGSLNNVMVNIGATNTLGLPAGWNRADLIMTKIAAGATTAATNTTALVGGGAGSLTLAQAQGLLIITPGQRAQLEGGLASFGSPITVTIAQADAVFKSAAATYSAKSTILADQSADVTQTGSGFTGIFSVNISPSDNLNIAIKYETETALNLKNKTTKDLLIGYTSTGTPITQFPDGDMTRNDMPALLSMGVDYKLSSSLKVSLGMNYFFDKSANYGHKINGALMQNKDIIESNGLSISGGVEYNITKKILVSGGYIWANKGVNAAYQSDLNYFLGSNTIGFGGAYNITDKIQINLGFSTTIYGNDSKNVDHLFPGVTTPITTLETYKKNTIMGGLGLDFRF